MSIQFCLAFAGMGRIGTDKSPRRICLCRAEFESDRGTLLGLWQDLWLLAELFSHELVA
jgi:hypothetical protein